MKTHDNKTKKVIPCSESNTLDSINVIDEIAGFIKSLLGIPLRIKKTQLRDVSHVPRLTILPLANSISIFEEIVRYQI